MTQLTLATEKLSPVAWWSVLLTNVSAAVGVVLFSGSIVVILNLLETDKLASNFIWPFLATAVGFSLFSRGLLGGSKVRRIRYSGTVEFYPLEGAWISTIPGWSLRGKRTRQAVTAAVYRLVKDLRESDSEKLQSVVGVIGVSDDGTYVIRPIHRCPGVSECDRQRVHLSGYRQAEDGQVF